MVVRYAFRRPTTWSFDLGYMMYGAVFFMAGAYTLSRGGHVRADIFYRLWSPRDPGARSNWCSTSCSSFRASSRWSGPARRHAADSWRYREVSIFSPTGVPL